MKLAQAWGGGVLRISIKRWDEKGFGVKINLGKNRQHSKGRGNQGRFNRGRFSHSIHH